MSSTIDILMITYNRPAYTRLSLSRLLETCDESMRVWLWHNGEDEETLAVVNELRDHPAVHRFHHSRENRRLREATNWLLSESAGAYVSKVDDDCLVPQGWAQTLRRAHEDEPRLGAIGCWHFMPDDLIPGAAESKTDVISGGHRIMRHPWVGGSGFLMKRECVDTAGLLRPNESGMTGYLTRLALKGWINGWYYPFLWQEHMDDPRSPHSLLKTDADLQKHLPLSAQTFGVRTLEEWDRRLRFSASELQRLPSDPRYYTRWRRVVRRRLQQLRNAAGMNRERVAAT